MHRLYCHVFFGKQTDDEAVLARTNGLVAQNYQRVCLNIARLCASLLRKPAIKSEAFNVLREAIVWLTLEVVPDPNIARGLTYGTLY
jgi:hypothetical protein